MRELESGEGLGAISAEGPLVHRLLRRAAGWPALVASGRPRRLRLQARAQAGRRPLLDAVARRWRVGGVSAWSGHAQGPLAVLRVPQTVRIRAEPALHGSSPEDREVPAAFQAARSTGRPAPAAPLQAVEAQRGVRPEPSGPPLPGPPTPASAGPGPLAVPLLGRLAGLPLSRPPLRATSRKERLAPTLARRGGPPTRREAPRAEKDWIQPVVSATPVAALRDASPTRREAPRADRERIQPLVAATIAAQPVGAPGRRPERSGTAPAQRTMRVAQPDRPMVALTGVGAAPAPASAQPAAALRVFTRPVRAPAVLGEAPRNAPRPGDRAAPAAATAEHFPWPVLLPLAPHADRASESAAVGSRPALRGPIPAAPPAAAARVATPPWSWPTDELPLARRATAAPMAVMRGAAAAAAPPVPAARPADVARPADAARATAAAPFPSDARPPTHLPQAGLDPLVRNEPRAARIRANRLAEQVYDLIVRRLEDERMRRGF